MLHASRSGNQESIARHGWMIATQPIPAEDVALHERDVPSRQW